MQQRDLYVLYVKQYCDSVNTFSCYLLSCFEEVRGLLLIGLKLLLVLMWVFSDFCWVWSVRISTWTHHRRALKVNYLAFPSKSLTVSLAFGVTSQAQHARELAVSGGREHKGPSLLAGWFAPHTRLCSLCGPAALMLGFSYLSPGKVNEVVALFEEVKMGWVAKTRGSLEMKRGALSSCKWQFWWIT